MPEQTREEMLAEADRRGLLTGATKTAYDEAKKRGLVKGVGDDKQPQQPYSEANRTLSSVNDKIAGAIGLPVDLARGGLEAVGVPVASAEKQFGGSESIRRAMRALGMSREGAEPETDIGKLTASTMGGAAEAALTGGGIGSLLKSGGRALGRPLVESLGESFAAPVPNVIAGSGAGAVGQAAEETGLPRPVGEVLGAAAAGRITPSTSLRAPRPSDPVLDAYERLRLSPSAGEAASSTSMGGRAVQWLQGNILPQTFGGGGKMEEFKLGRLREVTDIQERIAQSYGEPSSRIAAGEAIQNRIMDRWLAAKESAGDTIKSVTDRYSNDVIFAEEFANATASPVGAGRAKSVRDATIDPMVKIAQDAIRENGGHFSVSDLRALRTRFGNALEPGFEKNVNDAQVSQLYGAVTQDIENLIKARSPNDLATLKKANSEYKSAMDDFRQSFKKMVGTENVPVSAEKAYNILTARGSEKATADLEAFSTVWGALGKKERGTVAATVLSRMGAVDPNVPLSNSNFEIGKFLREYRGLNDQAKQMLFMQTGQGKVARELDDLTTVYENIQTKLSKLASTSKSGTGMVFAPHMGTATTGTIAAGFVDPWLAVATALTTLGGPRVAAEILTNPKAVRGLINSLEPIERAIDANMRAVPAMEAIDALKPDKPPERRSELSGTQMANTPLPSGDPGYPVRELVREQKKRETKAS